MTTSRPRSRNLVLFLDDDEDMRKLFGDILRDAGLEVIEARVAEEALAILEQQLPGVCIIDLMMPTGMMQGTELLALMREDPDWRQLPTIVISALGDMVNPDVTRGLAVRGVLTKTQIRSMDLVRAVKAALAEP